MLADSKVFPSESRLYGKEKLINHSLNSLEVKKRLFTPDEWDTRLLYPIVSTCAANMLVNYARKRLPGACYRDPDPKTIKELQPSNDICESILGMNDYLTTTIPNLHQMTRSTVPSLK